MKAALDAHDQGEFQHSGLLAEQIERNPRTFGALQTRELGVLGLPFELQRAERNAQRAESIRKELADAWDEIAPESVVGEMIRTMAVMGFSIAEIVWKAVDGTWLPKIVPVHSSHARWAEPFLEDPHFEVLTTSGYQKIVAGSGKWMLLASRKHRPWIRGVIRCLGIPDAIRGYAARDWARWSEKHGLPIIAAKVPSSESDGDDAFKDSLRTVGSEGVLFLPQVREEDGPSFDVSLLEPRDAAWKGFQELLAQCDEDTAVAVLGQTLTTKVSGGSLAAAKVHDRVRADYLEADANTLSTAFYQQVIKPWTLFNKGAPDLAPWPSWNATPPEDTETVAKTFQSGASALSQLLTANVPVNVEEFCKRLGIPLLTMEEALKKAKEQEALRVATQGERVDQKSADKTSESGTKPDSQRGTADKKE